ncbi:hypothetical protein [Methylobacterium oxalidis]|uniref:Anti-sigma factor NepR domain-containing protein n=1 Tax=Methylobacterium oxalidis TaxID=944322 RepID=A0A512J9A2_9HYPH|nr:hypothetical protein [Methylobacterium oxalidis]GEP06554.1 hypothetical protein MOX02_45920 [Methylobacterium oxalidis]GJE33751.1 hypothetical protein LDDCCGHA_3954 [Methylobacterium oxalidis]GLS63868.1 hypothetical protein GCM10007888_22490 [Methylobacterium oxalidis]
MRDCSTRRPFHSDVTTDPRLHGIARGLAELYEPQVRENPPERWTKLAAEVERRLRRTEPKGAD